MEELVYEEFDTENHEILAICLETESVSVGVSLFLSDREVEYYWEKFPDCCLTHTKAEDVPVRSFPELAGNCRNLPELTRTFQNFPELS